MLSSCANPSCSRQFRYLHEGKLFLLTLKLDETITSAEGKPAQQATEVQYAWLCDQCTQRFEVVLDSEGRVKVRSRYDALGLAV